MFNINYFQVVLLHFFKQKVWISDFQELNGMQYQYFMQSIVGIVVYLFISQREAESYRRDSKDIY